ncbi:MAG: putative glycosyl hydrolase [Acidobacteriaceae bacterium]|nr:putative glycosyl hydrolase [Acidobacteriaceae bacterium]
MRVYPSSLKRPFRGSSRRFFLKSTAATLAVLSTAPRGFAFATEPAALKRQRAFGMLPLGAVRPQGWLKEQLRVQAEGLSGHLYEIWPDVGPASGWLGGKGESWERGPYFLDGLVPLAWLLDDQKLKNLSQRFVDWTLSNQGADGMLGPSSNDDWWPRMVMLKVLAQYYEVTQDPRVLQAMSRYFDYQAKHLPSRPLKDWGRYRWQDEVLTVLWLYDRQPDPSLIALARLLYRQGYDWQSQFVRFPFTQPCTAEYLGLQPGENNDRAMQSHGVNNAMALKASPVWYLFTGDERERQGLAAQLAALDKYHGLPNGIFSADEHLAGRSPSQGTELCTVVEAMFSLEQSLAILGDPMLGDRLERIAFNALPGAFTDTMWAHQYNQQPNQVEVSLHRRPWTTDGPESNIYGLEPNFGCCTANYHQGWPKFTSSLVMRSADEGLVLAAYAPCEVQTTVRGVPVRLLVETEYPFRRSVRVSVHPEKPMDFPLKLRIPGWAKGTTISVNGRSEPAPEVQSFATVSRTWNADDAVLVDFPMEVRTSRWFNGSVALERGPLVFALDVAQDWLKLRDRGPASDWQVYPAGPWNYGLDPATISPRIEERPLPDSSPFTAANAPVRLEVDARSVPGWRAQDGTADPVPVEPAEAAGTAQVCRLVPYAAAKLRITAFPAIHSGDSLNRHV